MSLNTKPTLYFYDLETSGFDPRVDRIMQFAGQRTSLDLKNINKPDSFYIRITEDILPDPYAIMVTGITPQKTIKEGINEAEFLKIFSSSIATSNTIFVGFNSIRFDDEFMRFLHYRNFYDPYKWQWQNGRSRWDLLDLIRMTRALRPSDIQWPFDKEGKPTNKLELLTSVNGIEHQSAHDALSDVNATIEIAKLVRKAQPKLFNYLLKMRDKKTVKTFVACEEIFVYTSGKYPSEYEKTTLVTSFLMEDSQQNAWVYDLRQNPLKYQNFTSNQIIEAMKYNPDRKEIFPIKKIALNRCPAIAPMSVLDDKSIKRIKINLKEIENNYQILKNLTALKSNLKKAIETLNKSYKKIEDSDVEARLYDEFIKDADQVIMEQIISSSAVEIMDYQDKLTDQRLHEMLPLYKAKNFKQSLNREELKNWTNYCKQKLQSGNPSKMELYFKKITELSSKNKISKKKQYVLEELALYGQNLLLDQNE